MNIGSYVTRGARGGDSGEEDFGFWNLNGTLDFGIAQVQNGKWKLGTVLIDIVGVTRPVQDQEVKSAV